MGSNLNVISDMKQTVLREILSNEEIVKIVRNSCDVVTPDMELRYTQVYPWAFMPETVEETKVFVTFEVYVPRIINCAVKEFELRIYVMVPHSMMVMDTKVCDSLGLDWNDCGVRTDVLTDKIDYMLNGSEDMGFGKLELKSSQPFSPGEKYAGRMLTYQGDGWNRQGDRLWTREA